MNITIVAHSYIPEVGGSEETVRGLAKEFLNKFHRVTIIAFTTRKGFKAFEVIEGSDVYRIKVPFLIYPRRGSAGTGDALRLFLLLPRILIRLAKILRDSKTQIINVHFVGVNAFCVWALSYFIRLKYIVTLQGLNLQVLPFLKGIRGFIIRIVFRAILDRACFISACSQFLLNDAIERVPRVRPKSLVIPNGINLEEFRRNGQALINYPYILCLGRLHAPVKGFDMVLFAFKDILDSGFDIDLVLAGDGPARNVYKRFAKLLGIGERVYFFGVANREEVVNLLKNCEFFVMPSRIEPLGIVNLEAMACRKAVIASRTGGIPEVVKDGLTGLLVEPSNPRVLTAGIKRLLEDKDLRERLASGGQRIIEQGDFSWSVIAGRYLKLYARF